MRGARSVVLCPRNSPGDCSSQSARGSIEPRAPIAKIAAMRSETSLSLLKHARLPQRRMGRGSLFARVLEFPLHERDSTTNSAPIRRARRSEVCWLRDSRELRSDRSSIFDSSRIRQPTSALTSGLKPAIVRTFRQLRCTGGLISLTRTYGERI